MLSGRGRMSESLEMTVGIVRHRDGKNQAECATLLEIAEPPQRPSRLPPTGSDHCRFSDHTISWSNCFRIVYQTASSQYQCWGMRKFNTHRWTPEFTTANSGTHLSSKGTHICQYRLELAFWSLTGDM